MAELLGDDRAVGGAHVVEQGDGDGLALQAGQGDGPAELVDEVESPVPGNFRPEGGPLTAWVRMASALGLMAATAMGAAPTRVIPMAPRAAIDRKA